MDLKCRAFPYYTIHDEYNLGGIGNENFRVESVTIEQEPPTMMADPYSFTPRYADGLYDKCEATISFKDAGTLYSMIKYLEMYDSNTDTTQSIESLKHEYEEEINYIKEKYNALLEEVKELRKKKYIRYKIRHKVNTFKL